MPLAFISLAYNMCSGFIHAFDNSIPKYLKFYTVSIYSPYIRILELQFTNIACVLSMFIRKALTLQNYSKAETKCCNSSGDDAIRTISSAKDCRNN